jgi:hypothetical protein
MGEFIFDTKVAVLIWAYLWLCKVSVAQVCVGD